MSNNANTTMLIVSCCLLVLDSYIKFLNQTMTFNLHQFEMMMYPSESARRYAPVQMIYDVSCTFYYVRSVTVSICLMFIGVTWVLGRINLYISS